MMDFVATFQHWLTLVCFVALAVCLFALAVLRVIPELTDAIRRFCGMDNFSKVVCGVCIVGAVLYGGSKGVNVRWDDGLRDNGTLITNDTVSVRWTYSGIPGASSVFIDYREAGTTNNWLNLAETLANAQEWTGTLANATNYDYWVYSTYVPPVPVHTNGVWVGQAYETKAKVGAAAFLILNGKVVADGRTIAPPKWAEPSVPTARDYIQDGLIAMWDGIENAGWGVHDASATVWKDLVGNRDWTLGTSTSYEWTANSFDAKNQYAATQDFVSGALVDTVEVCAKTKYSGTPSANVAFVIIGRSTSATTGSYFGLLYRNQFTSMMSCYGFYANTYSSFKGQKTSFSFPSVKTTSGAFAYFNGTRMNSSGNNTLDYMETQRGSVARIGGIATSACPVEVFNIRLYNRTLSADEIRHNYEIDKRRFNLP